MKKILLYSGGMDSWLIDKIWKPDERVYIDMGTRYTGNEVSKLDESIRVVKHSLGQYEREDSIIPLRNLYLVMIICNEFPEGDLDICIGATAGDRVLDKSVEFADATSKLLSFLYSPQHWTPGRTIRVNVDYKNKTKSQLIKEYLDQGGDIKEAFKRSFSCYAPINGGECWACKPCFRKFVAFAMNGMEFDAATSEKAINYIKQEILPLIKSGAYGRREEEQEILEIMRRQNEECL